MAEMIYADQLWPEGTAVEGEKLSANGYYTGQHLGMPTQAANEADVNVDPYFVEHETVRFGTITQDAAANANMPVAGVNVAYILSNCSATPIGNTSKSENFEATVTAFEGYTLPATIQVKIGGAVKTASTDYTWTQGSGKLTIATAKITGDIEITVTATKAD